MQSQVLSDEDVGSIHEATRKVLAKTGVGFKDSPQALEIFRTAGCRVDDERVHFSHEVITEGLARIPDRDSLDYYNHFLGFTGPVSLGQGDVSFGLIGNAFTIHDYEAGEARSCLESDVNDKLLVLDSLPNFDYDCCNLFTAHDRGIADPVARPYDNSEAGTRFLRQWVRGRAVPGRKTMPFGCINTTQEEVRLTVLGRAILEGVESTEALLKRQLSFVWCNPLSPLRIKGSEANAIIAAARSGVGMNMISPEVMWGATGPVTLAGSLVQHNAEVLAGVLLSQFASPGSACIYGCVSAPMDMHTADTHHGAFETALFDAAAVQLADRYGLPSRISPGNTSQVRPGPRAYGETAMGLYLGAAAGGNIITTGLLDSTIRISYEHLVVVDELINQVRNITKPVATDADSLALDVIDRVCNGDGNFLADDHTLANMKRDVHYSAFTGRTEDSFMDVYDRAHQTVEQILARRDTDEHVDKDVLDRLVTVEARLKEDDTTWRTGEGDWWRTYLEDLT
ncbi:MAG TPA: trimethylamine methyltransferase family protein [Candidatus Latescibacteria bacterium]|nr:trimethylamine methyltransferase family protein [Candidatus Latescibacterota bacterium]